MAAADSSRLHFLAAVVALTLSCLACLSASPFLPPFGPAPTTSAPQAFPLPLGPSPLPPVIHTFPLPLSPPGLCPTRRISSRLCAAKKSSWQGRRRETGSWQTRTGQAWRPGPHAPGFCRRGLRVGRGKHWCMRKRARTPWAGGAKHVLLHGKHHLEATTTAARQQSP